MRTRMNRARFFCCLLVTVIGMTIACAEAEPMAKLTRAQESSDLQRYVDSVRNLLLQHSTLGKPRHGKRNDAAPMMELNATWETLKMIQDAQRKNEQREQENIRRNKEQILLRDFPSLDVDEYTSYGTIRSGSLPDIIDKYYDKQ